MQKFILAMYIQFSLINKQNDENLINVWALFKFYDQRLKKNVRRNFNFDGNSPFIVSNNHAMVQYSWSDCSKEKQG